MKPPHEMSSEELADYMYDTGAFYQSDRCVSGVTAYILGVSIEVKRQCNHKPGHGPGGLYCKQHAKRWEATP